METEPSTVRFVVYGDPVPKERARTVTDVKPNGKKVTHSYTPENTSIHEQKIALVYKSIYHGFKFREGVPLLFAVDVYLPIPKRTSKRKVEAMIAGEIRPVGHVGDVDNYEKCAADALLKIAYEDDWFIYHKKVIVVTKCDKMREFLEISGTVDEGYEIYANNKHSKVLQRMQDGC